MRGVGEDLDDQGGVDQGDLDRFPAPDPAAAGGQDGRPWMRSDGWAQQRGDLGGLGVGQCGGAARDDQLAGPVGVRGGEDESVGTVQGPGDGPDTLGEAATARRP